MKAEAAAKREEIEKKEKERNMPVDDSEMIVKLFGFLPTDQTAEGDGEIRASGCSLWTSPCGKNRRGWFKRLLVRVGNTWMCLEGGRKQSILKDIYYYGLELSFSMK